MDSGQEISITPEELAQALFSRAVEDMSTVLASHNDRFKSFPSFQPNRFERRKFLYLVADMAIALTNAAQQQSAMAEVIPHFRHTVVVMMQKYWGDTEVDIDAEIEKASADYARLLFTSPEENKGLSFDWAQDWLKHVGIDETNPAVLFGISQTWRLFHAHTVKCLSSMHIIQPVGKPVKAPAAKRQLPTQLHPTPISAPSPLHKNPSLREPPAKP